jgi:hypothetical protein
LTDVSTIEADDLTILRELEINAFFRDQAVADRQLSILSDVS